MLYALVTYTSTPTQSPHHPPTHTGIVPTDGGRVPGGAHGEGRLWRRRRQHSSSLGRHGPLRLGRYVQRAWTCRCACVCVVVARKGVGLCVAQPLRGSIRTLSSSTSSSLPPSTRPTPPPQSRRTCTSILLTSFPIQTAQPPSTRLSSPDQPPTPVAPAPNAKNAGPPGPNASRPSQPDGCLPTQRNRTK